MEQIKSYIKFYIIAGFLCLLLTGCKLSTKEEKMLTEATSNFHYQQSDLLLEKFHFDGPVINDKIGNFESHKNFKLYSWYHIHEKDTFWIYVEVDKNLNKESSVSFSENFWEMRDNRNNWK